jgi:hypothetical protein
LPLWDAEAVPDFELLPEVPDECAAGCVDFEEVLDADELFPAVELADFVWGLVLAVVEAPAESCAAAPPTQISARAQPALSHTCSFARYVRFFSNLKPQHAAAPWAFARLAKQTTKKRSPSGAGIVIILQQKRQCQFPWV